MRLWRGKGFNRYCSREASKEGAAAQLRRLRSRLTREMDASVSRQILEPNQLVNRATTAGHEHAKSEVSSWPREGLGCSWQAQGKCPADWRLLVQQHSPLRTQTVCVPLAKAPPLSDRHTACGHWSVRAGVLWREASSDEEKIAMKWRLSRAIAGGGVSGRERLHTSNLIPPLYGP